MMRRSIFALFIVLFVAPVASAQTGVTGNWTGTYTFSVQLSGCSNKTYSASGNASMTLLETGTSVSGRIDLANFLSFGSSCTAATAEFTKVIVGNVAGSTISWTLPNDTNLPQFTGTINGNTIAAQWTDASGANGSLTLTRTAGDAPATDVTGAWTGNYSFTDRCSNNATQSYNGTFTLALTQSGANAGGVVTLQNVPLYDQNCSKITALDMAMAAAGTVSGSTFTGGAFDPSGSFDFPITATLGTAGMNGSVTGASDTNTTGSFTLTQSNNAPPASDLSGTYEGSYNETDNESFTCLNIGALTYSGAASLTVVHAGTAVSGWFTLHNTQTVTSDGMGDCFVVSGGDQVLPLYGTTNGNAVTLDLPVSGGYAVFAFTFNGAAATGNLTDPIGDVASINATRVSTAVPPSKRRIVRP